MAYYALVAESSDSTWGMELTGASPALDEISHLVTGNNEIWGRNDPRPPKGDGRSIPSTDTSGVSGSSWYWSSTDAVTGEVQLTERPSSSLPPASVSEDPFEKANRDRITLLQRVHDPKYSVTEHEAARLRILSRKVAQLLPAITKVENDELERISDFLVRARGQLETIEEKYGLK